VALAGPCRKPEEEGEQGRLWLFWFSGFLLPNERGTSCALVRCWEKEDGSMCKQGGVAALVLAEKQEGAAPRR